MSDTEGALAPPEGVIPNFKHPQDVLKTINTVTQISSICLVTFFVFLRIYTKSRLHGLMEREDWLCIASWVFVILFCSNTLSMSYTGGGVHQWEVTKHDIVAYRKAVYRGFLIYGLTALLVKITLLLIFTRIFAIVPRAVIIIYFFIGFITLYYLLAFVIKIRICTPIAGFWDPNLHPSCINEYAFFLADSILSLVTDVVVLVIPIPLLWMLDLPLGKKVKVVALLAAGGAAIGTSIARLLLVFSTGMSEDTTISVLRLTLLASAEVSIGMICASLPALNIFFRRYIGDRKANGQNASGEEVELGNTGEGSGGRNGRSIMKWTYNKVGSKARGLGRGKIRREDHVLTA
ncbi:uncharacterized protein PAC_17222 [Phialocephala subalpina]|uniref:Rhodopsin domain-containing protein n=1 Tax=Phialocephala subalpina TaxID=576137 RepID=A0A1L7XQK8_9HELO|nr:uncharacterized protein PAC_17222 [Phialocephala subalpina]